MSANTQEPEPFVQEPLEWATDGPAPGVAEARQRIAEQRAKEADGLR